MERLNERIASLREQINTSEVLSPEQKGELSDTETVRFILCSHIHARLLTTKALEKVTELPLKNLVERFAKLHLFELTTGRNNNITKLIQHLWIKQPLLAPPISNS